MEEQKKLLVVVDGKKINLKEFNEMLINPKIRLKKISENEYKTLQRLEE